MEKGKGLELFLKLIPNIQNLMKCNSHIDLSFDIYGDGSLSNKIIYETSKLNRKGFKVKYHGYTDTKYIYEKTWCVFSLQEITNYPSRVVAESLLNGCEVVVLNSGDSSQFGSLCGLHYLQPDLANLNDVIMKLVINQGFSDIDYTTKIIKNAEFKFCSKDYINYYNDLIS